MACCGDDDERHKQEVGLHAKHRAVARQPQTVTVVHAAHAHGATCGVRLQSTPARHTCMQGVVGNRGCRDVLFLLLFIGYWAGMFVVCGIAFQQGEAAAVTRAAAG
jgi:hypothetical protein